MIKFTYFVNMLQTFDKRGNMQNEITNAPFTLTICRRAFKTDRNHEDEKLLRTTGIDQTKFKIVLQKGLNAYQ